ncbi:hypothetical protein DFH11DRAFT_1593894 [Phellopilus nigrolimitatus]|nr:hypothetical protein DFH11DRAFT_1593894 [Phellopilus nigrolimitatus]
MHPSFLVRSAGRVSRAATEAGLLNLNVPATRFASTSSMHNNDPEVLEREKQKNLSGEQDKTSAPHEHAPGWNEHLASSSEASVKADRNGKQNPEELQQESTERANEAHHAEDKKYQKLGTTGVNEAEYKKDEVGGPLKGAKSSGKT